MVVPDVTGAAVGQPEEVNIAARDAQVTERGAGLVHAQRPEIQGLRRPTEMLIVAVAGARVAAREVDKVNRNAVLNRRADDPVVGAFVILVRAKDQDGLGQRVHAQFHRVRGEDGAGRIVHLDLDGLFLGHYGYSC